MQITTNYQSVSRSLLQFFLWRSDFTLLGHNILHTPKLEDTERRLQACLWVSENYIENKTFYEFYLLLMKLNFVLELRKP